jgi:hypothetical protein
MSTLINWITQIFNRQRNKIVPIEDINEEEQYENINNNMKINNNENINININENIKTKKVVKFNDNKNNIIV